MIEMESKIVNAAPFCPAFTPRQHGNLYEIRAYTMQPGVAQRVVQRWAERIEGRVKLSPLAAAGHTELGPLNQWIHIWAYKDANERARIREESRKDGTWPPATRGMFIKQENSSSSRRRSRHCGRRRPAPLLADAALGYHL